MSTKLRTTSLGVPEASVTASQLSGIAHNRTVLTLTDVSVTAANTTGVSFGGTKIFTFPAGVNYVVTSVLELLTFDLTDAGNATPVATTHGGDISVGTTAPTDGTLSTTDVNLIPKTSIDPISGGVAGAHLAAPALFDGHTTATPVFVNMIIDDADVADGASDVILVSGTVTLTWVEGGDY